MAETGGCEVKRYLLFGNRRDTPHGGWGDFVCAYPTRQDAETVADLLMDGRLPEHERFWWTQVVDTEAASVVSYRCRVKPPKLPGDQ